MELVLGYQLIVALGAGLTIALRRSRRSEHGVVTTLLEWTLAINTGLAGFMAAFAHTALAAQTAESIGWAPGSPFQFEVAMANLAFGVLGVLCIWFRGGFWWATAIGWAVFLWGAAVGHIVQIVTVNNLAPNNAGAILYWDILAPLVTLVLLALLARSRPAERKAAAQATI